MCKACRKNASLLNAAERTIMAENGASELKSMKESVESGALDLAEGVLEEISNHHVDHSAARALLWKIDMRLMPLV